MLRPSSKLLSLAAVVVVPICAIAGFIPAAFVLCAAALAVLVAAAGYDAWRAERSIREWKISCAPTLKWFQNRKTSLAFEMAHPNVQPRVLRVAPELPPEIVPESEMLTVEVAGRGTIQMDCQPLRRGAFALSICHVETGSDWGLWRAARAVAMQCEIRVYPDLRSEGAADLLIARTFQGLHHQRQLGKGREFEKLREYTQGDSYEDIHWKATARRGRPVVKVFQIERTQEIYVIVDASRLSARGDVLDRYVSAALRLAAVAEKQHDRFGLAVFSAGIDRFVAPGSGTEHFAVCREAIYAIQPRAVTPDLQEIFSFLHVRLRRRALLIFLTSLEDPSLAEAFLRDIPVLSRRHLILVNVPEQDDTRPLFSGPEPANVDGIYARLAAHLSWTKMRELQRALDHHGVRMAMVNPEQLAARIARQYLDVKQRQLL